MGWAYIDAPHGPTTEKDAETEILRMCRWTNAAYSVDPVSIFVHGSIFHVGLRFTPTGAKLPDNIRRGYVPDAEGRIVIAAVFLTSGVKSTGGWGWKDMTEMMGPAEAHAPPAFLATLSALDGEPAYAHDWRKRCRAHYPQMEAAT